jgi:hypothetical protein
MTPGEKAHFDSLMEIKKLWIERCEKRLNATWRLSLGLWTVLVLYFGSVTTRTLRFSDQVHWCYFLIVGILIVLLQFIWLRRTGRSNQHDWAKSNYVDEDIMALAKKPWPDHIKRTDEHYFSKASWNWSHIYFLIVTALFVALALLVTFAPQQLGQNVNVVP